MMSIARGRETVLGAALVLMLASCANLGRFDASPSHPVDLAGNWALNKAASDDPQKLINELRPKGVYGRNGAPPDDEPTVDRQSSGGQPQGAGGRGGRRSDDSDYPQRSSDSTYRNDVYVRAPLMRALMSDLRRADQLVIRQSEDEFVLDYGASVRSFTPGGKSVVSASWGVADQSSGWKGKEYVIAVKPQQGVPSFERYGLSPDGKQLIEELRLGGGDYPSIQLKRVYDRTDQPLRRSLPMSD